MLLLEPAGQRFSGNEFFDDNGRAGRRQFCRVEYLGEDLATDVLQFFVGKPHGLEALLDKDGPAVRLVCHRIFDERNRAMRGFLDDVQRMVTAR